MPWLNPFPLDLRRRALGPFRAHDVNGSWKRPLETQNYGCAQTEHRRVKTADEILDKMRDSGSVCSRNSDRTYSRNHRDE
jgi:NAD-dependent DNA ligase